MDGQDPKVFDRSPNLNNTVSRLRYKKIINETRFEYKTMKEKKREY